MAPGVATKVISASFGLSAFTVATVIGLWIDNPAHTILSRALVSMLVCQAIGLIIGAISERTATEAIAQYQKANAVDGARLKSAARAEQPVDDDVLTV
jgi:tetrahydromethanopterin S-methyltransferase subunit C